MRVFGVVSDDGTAAGLRPLTERVRTFQSGCHGHEHLWMVGSTAREVLRWEDAPTGPRALTEIDVGRRSALRLRIVTSGSALGSTYEIDLGQSLELVAESLYVELLAPEGAMEVVNGSEGQEQGLLFDTLCLVRLLRLEVSRGRDTALLTQSVFVPANQAHVQRVPCGAQRMSVYGEPSFGFPQLRWLRGDPAFAAVELGSIQTLFGLPRWDIDVPSASHLTIEPFGAARTFTFVWTIAP